MGKIKKKNKCTTIPLRLLITIVEITDHWSVIAVYSNQSCAHKGETEASQNIKINL